MYNLLFILDLYVYKIILLFWLWWEILMVVKWYYMNQILYAYGPRENGFDNYDSQLIKKCTYFHES